MNIKLSAFLMLASFVGCAMPSAQADASSLTTAEINAMSSDELKALTSDKITALKKEQITALSAEQLQDLKPEQIAEFTSDQVKYLTPPQIGDLTSDQLRALIQSQIQVLTADQLHAITPYKIKALSAAQVADLTVEQIKELTPDQTKALRADQTKNFTTEQLQALLAGTANTANSSVFASNAVPLAQAHSIFANQFPGSDQNKRYPAGPRDVLFITPNELDNSAESNNWARLRYGASTVISQPINGFILVEAPSRVEQVYVYVAAENNTFDLTKKPYQVALSPKLARDHYGDLNPFTDAGNFLRSSVASVYPLLGVSVNKLGDKTTTNGNPTTFLFGTGIDLGPYAGVNLGLAGYSRDNHIISGLSVGFSLDTAILGKIFSK